MQGVQAPIARVWQHLQFVVHLMKHEQDNKDNKDKNEERANAQQHEKNTPTRKKRKRKKRKERAPRMLGCARLCVFTLSRSFYPSTPSTPSVRAHSFHSKEVRALSSQNYATERVDNETPCHRTGYDKHIIHTPSTHVGE